jgi:hypothetical protein
VKRRTINKSLVNLDAEFKMAEMMHYAAALADPIFKATLKQGSATDSRGGGEIGDFFIPAPVTVTQPTFELMMRLLDKCIESVQKFLLFRLKRSGVYSNLTYMASFDMTYCFDVCQSVISLLAITGWESNRAKERLGLHELPLEWKSLHLKRLAIERNTPTYPQSSWDGRDEDEDPGLSFMRPANLNDAKKHPFERMEEHLRTIYTFLADKEKEKIHFLARNNIMNPGHNGAGQESGATTRAEELEARGGMEMPELALVSGRAGAREHAGSLIDNGVPSLTPEGSTRNTEPFPSNVFPQISFWPRMLQ